MLLDRLDAGRPAQRSCGGNALSRPAEVGRSGPGLPEDACAACRHPLHSHDQIGLRFCAATVDGALSRGCVCVPAATDVSARKRTWGMNHGYDHY